MATQTIINLAEYRLNRDSDQQYVTNFNPTPDRLWEYLARNIKITTSDAGPSSSQGKAV